MIALRSFDLEESDQRLIRRFARRRDDSAFSIIMGRYADMVYTTCRRVLGDEAQAADAAQETFFELAKKADGITGSLGSWLHKVATRRAVDLIRQNVSRRRREAVYAADALGDASSWSEVEPAVDEALEALAEDQQELLRRHFLQRRSTVQLAAEQGVSQPTISRRIAEALDGLRRNLRERGIQVGLVPLQTLLLHSHYVAPEALRISLGKLGLVTAAADSAWLLGAAAPATGVGIKALVAVATVAAVIGTVGVAWYQRHQGRSPSPARTSVAQQTLNAAVADSAPGRINLRPFGQQVSATAARPSQSCSIAAGTAPWPVPISDKAPPLAAKSSPATRAPETPANRHRAASTTAVANAQVWPAHWSTAAQLAPLLIVPRRYEGSYHDGVVVRAGIYQPLPTGLLTVPFWNQGPNRLVTLGPGIAVRVVSIPGPAPLKRTGPPKRDPGQGRSARGQ